MDTEHGRGQGDYEAKDGDTCGACGATMGSVAVHSAWHLQTMSPTPPAPANASR